VFVIQPPDQLHAHWQRITASRRPDAVTYPLIEIRCATWNLGDRPVTDRSAEGCHVHLMEEGAERGIRRRSLQLNSQRLGEYGVVADGESLQIPQALAAAQNSENGHQQQIPRQKPNPAAASEHLETTSDS